MTAIYLLTEYGLKVGLPSRVTLMQLIRSTARLRQGHVGEHGVPLGRRHKDVIKGAIWQHGMLLVIFDGMVKTVQKAGTR